MTARFAKTLLTLAFAVALLTGAGCKRGNSSHDDDSFSFSFGSFEEWFGGWDFSGPPDDGFCYDGYSCGYDDSYFEGDGYGYDEWWKKKQADARKK